MPLTRHDYLATFRSSFMPEGKTIAKTITAANYIAALEAFWEYIRQEYDARHIGLISLVMI